MEQWSMVAHQYLDIAIITMFHLRTQIYIKIFFIKIYDNPDGKSLLSPMVFWKLSVKSAFPPPPLESRRGRVGINKLTHSEFCLTMILCKVLISIWSIWLKTLFYFIMHSFFPPKCMSDITLIIFWLKMQPMTLTNT